MAHEKILEELDPEGRAADFLGPLSLLPDPDPILHKMGGGMELLRTIRADPDVQSCIEDRKSTTLLKKHHFLPGDGSRAAHDLRDRAAEKLTPDALYTPLSEMLDAPYFGAVPIEIMWDQMDGRFDISGLSGLRPEYLRFTRKCEAYLTFMRPVPENKMVIAQNFPTRENPYGERLLSSVLWPVLFKKGGLKYWYTFLDRFGIPKLWAEVPAGKYDELKDKTLEQLGKMVKDAIGVLEEGTKVNTIEVRVSGDGPHKVFYDVMTQQISRSIVGGTLSRMHGNIGSYAQAREHGTTGERRSLMDQMRNTHTINRALRLVQKVNNDSVPPPVFEYMEQKDLSHIAAINSQLHAQGVRWTKEHFAEVYDIPPHHIREVVESEGAGGLEFQRFARAPSPEQHEIELFFEEQVRDAVEGVTDGQVRGVTDAIRNARSAHDLDRRLVSALGGMGDSDFFQISDLALAAAEMYGRATIRADAS